MIIPSIDIIKGEAVQLVQGKRLAINGGCPLRWADTFSIGSEIAVIDLDAAFGDGSNEELILELCKKYRVRVGGGIRSTEKAKRFLDAGATKVIIGTNANKEFLSTLPKHRVIVALDCKDQQVYVDGWRRGTGLKLQDQLDSLADYVSGFLVTFIEAEGTMSGIPMETIKKLRAKNLTVAGGIKSPEEIRELDSLGIDAQVGMAIYSGALSYSECLLAPLKGDLIPTIVADERDRVLGLVWSTKQSLKEAIETRSGVYFSRSRREIWKKGETSGSKQELIRVSLDCDRDTVKFNVLQSGGFCHEGSYSCFADPVPLERLVAESKYREGSYTKKILEDPELRFSKIQEEAEEFISAPTRENLIWEAADLFYFMLTHLAANNVTFSEVERELQRRRK
jgi:phosphoribosyl-ATP pyrophosphohydrolase